MRFGALVERDVHEIRVRIALQQQDRATEDGGARLDPRQDVDEAGQALVRPGEGVRLHQQDDASSVVFVGRVEGFVDPRDGGIDPSLRLRELRRRWRAQTGPRSEAVVRADHVGRSEDALRLHPEHVLGVARLRDHLLLSSPECLPGLGEEDLPQLRQPLERVVGAVRRPVAVGPLVVSGREHERILERGEESGDRREVAVVTAGAATLDVA